MRFRPPRWRSIVALFCVVGLVAFAVQMNRTQLWEDKQLYAGWRVQQHVVLGACRLLDRQQSTRHFGWTGDCVAALDRAKHEEGLRPVSRHLVLLLHGMGRSTFVFHDMEQALRAAGYEAVAISYPSLTKGIAGHADQIDVLLEAAEDVDKVSFVTHSLGGLVVRETLTRDGAWRDSLTLGRVVMIAPPNGGSELAEALDGLAPYHWIGGPSASEIAAGPRFARLPAEVEVAVIAGATADGQGFNPLLSENNDGVVTLTETALPGVRDSMTVAAVHTVIAAAPETIAATLNFLDTGQLR